MAEIKRAVLEKLRVLVRSPEIVVATWRGPRCADARFGSRMSSTLRRRSMSPLGQRLTNRPKSVEVSSAPYAEVVG